MGDSCIGLALGNRGQIQPRRRQRDDEKAVTAFSSKPTPAVDRGRQTPSPEIVAVPRTNSSPRGTAPQADLSFDLATITPAATRGAPPAAQAGAGITAVSRLPFLLPSTTIIPRAEDLTETSEPDTVYLI